MVQSPERPQQRHPTTRQDAFLDGRPGRVQGIVDAILAFLDLDLGRAADADHRDAARELGETLLKLLTVVVRGGLLDLRLDLRDAGLDVASNTPVRGVASLPAAAHQHTLIDLGDDAYTVGRPHPMIEPAVRDKPLREALSDPSCRVVLLDCVLGYGAHPDPAGHLQASVTDRAPGPRIVASVTGTEADPQRLSVQTGKLKAAGIEVAASNADAARIAIGWLTATT